MDRKLVIDLIVKEYRTFGKPDQEAMFRESLKWISDMNLLGFATELGIDLTAVRS
jgi:hypothetical protein